MSARSASWPKPTACPFEPFRSELFDFPLPEAMA